MYFINNGIRHDVYEAINAESDEFVYVVVCSECGDYRIFSEYDFMELIDNGEIDVICNNPDDKDDLSCDGDCDNCSENDNYYEDKLESDIEDLFDGILEELHELKEMMVDARECGNIGLYKELVKVYVELFKLIK